MILITSANYLSSEFQSEFGKIPPSFLPLGARRLYEYQAGLFSDFTKNPQKIILSLPQSFAISDFEKAKIAKLGITPLFVPENLSLGQSITYCLNMNLPLNEPLQILHGDTYFTRFAPQNPTDEPKNTLGISKALYGYEYAKLDSHKFALKDKITNTQDFVLNGYFCIVNPYRFIEALIRANYDFITALKFYSQDFAFHLLRNDFWLDFGLISSYFHGKSVIFSHRHFNSMEIDSHKHFIHKTSHHTDKIRAEIEWFESLPNDLRLFAPKIYPNQNKKSYKCEYLYLNTLAEIFVFGRLSSYAYKTIFEKIAQVLGKIHAQKPVRLPRRAFGRSCNDNFMSPNFNYAQKSAERLSAFAKERHFNLNKPFRFNDKIAPSLNTLLDKLEHFISADFAPCFIHGDFCFSNICFDFRSLRPKIFDPRGLDFSGNPSVYGDKRYDFAKLSHSVLGLYDFIVFGFYECDFGKSSEFYEVQFRVEISKDIKAIWDIFLDCFADIAQNKDEILAIMCHLFLSMLPLHCDDKARQNALLANAYRIYFDFLNGGGK
ncbi:phosphotransferase [Helicobacter sp. T3_23-1056]